MKIMKHKDARVFLVAVSLAIAIIGCGSQNSITVTGPSPAGGSQPTPTAQPPEIQRSEDGQTYVRKDGWPIPSFGEAEREEVETFIPTAEGRTVKVYRTSIKVHSFLLFTGNPLHFIGIGRKDILIQAVKEYRTSAGIFCYKFLVNDADVDENTGKLLPTRHILYPYSYYDEDGDGIFESLVISEKKDRFGHEGFYGEPHLPNWAVK